MFVLCVAFVTFSIETVERERRKKFHKMQGKIFNKRADFIIIIDCRAGTLVVCVYFLDKTRTYWLFVRRIPPTTIHKSIEHC